MSGTTPEDRPALKVSRSEQLRGQADMAMQFVPPAPIMVSAWEAKTLADALDRRSPLPERDAVLEALADLLDVCTYATFDNGVTAPDGRNEADYWASQAIDRARAILGVRPVEIDSTWTPWPLAERVRMRLDAVLARDGSVEAAIRGRGVGISFLLAQEIYRALKAEGGGA